MSTAPATKKINWTETLVLFGFLLFVLATPLIFDPNDEQVWNKVSKQGQRLLPYFLLILLNHFVLLPRLLFRNRRAAYVLACVMLVSLMAFVEINDRKPPFRDKPGISQQDSPPPLHRPDKRQPPGPKLSPLPQRPHINPNSND